MMLEVKRAAFSLVAPESAVHTVFYRQVSI